MRKPISSDSTNLSKINLSNGDLIVLQNENVELAGAKKETSTTNTNKNNSNTTTTTVVKKCNHSDKEKCINCMSSSTEPKKNNKTEVKDIKDVKKACTHSIGETCLNCIEIKNKLKQEKENQEKQNQSILEARKEYKDPSTLSTKEKKEYDAKNFFLDKQNKENRELTDKCTHNVGQKCIHCMPQIIPGGKHKKDNILAKIKFNCRHGEGGKCPNCVDEGYISNAKHKSFENFLREKMEKCKGIHESTSKCENCLPPAELVYKMKQGCPNHLPYPKGLCNQCQPPNAILNRQIYR